jgi:iron complex transport system substrate-binding protein
VQALPRIVSLLPAATEIVALLGHRPALVAISHECELPDGLPALPRVTSSRARGLSSGEIDESVRHVAASGLPLFALDEAAILEVRPTLILSQGLCDVCAISERDVRDIASRVGARVVSLSASTLDEVWASIACIGDAIGAPKEAAEWLAGAQHRLRTIHEILKAARAPRPRMVLLEWTDPLYVAGHWVPEMIAKAGGVDALGQVGARSAVVTETQVRESRPDILVIAPCGFDLDGSVREARALLDRDGAVLKKPLQVWALDGNAFTSRPGPRLCDGTETLARIMHPDLFGPPLSTRAIQLP